MDGVIAGYSEFRIENMIKLCNRLGLPCYINEDQLTITRDKIKFKDCCRKYGVPVVKEYAGIDDVDAYPVIVKPTDRAGSIGISIASDYDELVRAYQYAYELSVEKRVIIEQFIYNADKVDFYYLVESGEITLISSCDTVNAKNNGFSKVVQTAWLYPERRQQAYDRTVRKYVEAMIRGIGIQNGCIFFSGFVDKNDNFVFFECGYRLEGAHQYYYTEKRGPVNFLDSFISHSLWGNNSIVKHKAVNEKMKCVTVNVFAKSGEISQIDGAADIATMKNCTLSLVHGRVGQKCDETKAILDKIGVFAFSSESTEELIQDVNEMYQKLKITDTNGNDMIFDRLDAEVIRSWWR